MQHLTLFTEDPEGEYSSQQAVWRRFEKAFLAAAGLISHAPVLRDYLYRGLSELHLDNIMYLELRSGLSKVLTRPLGSPELPVPILPVCFRRMSWTGPSTRRSGPSESSRRLPRGLWRTIRTFSGLVLSFLHTGGTFVNVCLRMEKAVFPTSTEEKNIIIKSN